MSYCTLEETAFNEIVVQLPSGHIEKMNIEEYVKGVVPCEMPALWPMAALEAQAICARTYALAQRGRHKDQDFDVCSTAHCQVYNEEKKHPRTNLAVERTWSIVGMYDGKLQPMWFSASCGGQTKDNFWPDSYLQVRDDCPCGKSINGHQNGLCQWGAKALAEGGSDFMDILDFYYDLEYLDNYGVTEYDEDPDFNAARFLALENLVSEVEARGLNMSREVGELQKQIASLATHSVHVERDVTERLRRVEADLEALAPLIRLFGGLAKDNSNGGA